MGRQDTRKPFASSRLAGFLERLSAKRSLRNETRDDTQTGMPGHARSIQDGGMGLAETARSGLSDKLASELFARLLLELPEHRRDLQTAYQNGNDERLAKAVHKLLGAVLYCDLPDLAAALRELKRTTGTGNTGRTGPAFSKTIRLIDELLEYSGYNGDY